MSRCKARMSIKVKDETKCEEQKETQSTNQGAMINLPIQSYYRAEGAYPEIKVEGKCSRYAKLLLHDYAGLGSELTAITSYAYRHLVSGPQDELIAQAFIGVAIVEMSHLDMLGEAILKLGINPKHYTSNKRKDVYWTADNVDYTDDLESMLRHSISEEYKAIKQYKDHIACIDDENIKALLGRIIEDERMHIQLFKLLLQTVGQEKDKEKDKDKDKEAGKAERKESKGNKENKGSEK